MNRYYYESESTKKIKERRAKRKKIIKQLESDNPGKKFCWKNGQVINQTTGEIVPGSPTIHKIEKITLPAQGNSASNSGSLFNDN